MSQTENEFMELQEDLLKSINHQIHWLTAIKTEIDAGTYSPEQAGLDYENAINTEGFDWLSVLLNVSESS